MIPTESSRSGNAFAEPDQALTALPVPDSAAATRHAISAARAWTTAAHSSAYRDPQPGTWTARARPFVTGAEAIAERRQSGGGGGSTWQQITIKKCTTTVRQLAASMPSDAPNGPTKHIVYVAAVVALTCATGQIQLSHFTAQIIVTRVHSRWLVSAVRH